MRDRQDLNNFNSLFDDYFQRFVHFACSYVKEITVAEDIAMESFMAYWERRTTLTPDTHPQAYILTVIKNKCISHLRHLQTINTVANKLTEHHTWKLNLQIATLEVCNPQELFSSDVQNIIQQVFTVSIRP